ncbi:hypothetical protein WDZ92_30235, partial [Nostoc sp. NIES-2111]
MAITFIGSYPISSISDQEARSVATIDTTGVDLIVVMAASQNNAPVTDSRGNTYTALTARNNARLYYSKPTNVGPNTQFNIGATGTGGAYPSGVVMLFSGAGATQPQSQGTGSTVTSAASISTGSFTPGEAGCVVVAGFAVDGLSVPTVTGVTQAGALGGVSAQSLGSAAGYLIQSSAAAVNATATPSSGTWSGNSVIAAFRAAAAAGPTITTQPSSSTVTAPATASFTVTATASGGGTLSYQWQRLPSGGSWANVATGTGGTTNSYTTAATSVTGGNHNNADQYRCVVTETGGTNAGSTTSSAATLTVNATPSGPTINTQPS